MKYSWITYVVLITSVQKVLIYIYIHSFSYSFPLWFITGYWLQFPVLYSRTLLFTHPICNRFACNFWVHMSVCFCRVSSGSGFADQRVGVSLTYWILPIFKTWFYLFTLLPAVSCCSTFLPAFDIIIFKYLAKIMGVY